MMSMDPAFADITLFLVQWPNFFPSGLNNDYLIQIPTPHKSPEVSSLQQLRSLCENC